MRPGVADVDLVQVPLLKEQRIAQIRNGPGPLSVRADACPVAVHSVPGIPLPVLKVSQSATVDFIHGLSADYAVLAAPYPVAAFHRIVHVRHSSL